jgi:hypothetical protein
VAGVLLVQVEPYSEMSEYPLPPLQLPQRAPDPVMHGRRAEPVVAVQAAMRLDDSGEEIAHAVSLLDLWDVSSEK